MAYTLADCRNDAERKLKQKHQPPSEEKGAKKSRIRVRQIHTQRDTHLHTNMEFSKE